MARKLGKAALIIGLASAAVSTASAALMTGVWGREVVILSPAFPPDLVESNRLVWSKGDSVAEIYGVPSTAPLRVVFADPAKIVVPEEDRSLTLLRVDKQKGENPLQAKSLWFVTFVLAIPELLLALSGGAILWWTGRRRG